MFNLNKSADLAAQLMLKHAKLLAVEVARVEVIVNHAIGAASMAVAAKGINSTAVATQCADDTLRAGNVAAAKSFRALKADAKLVLSLARTLASTRLAENNLKKESASETLQIARSAAKELLEVAKKEAELVLLSSKNLASVRLAEENLKLDSVANLGAR